MLVLLAMWPWMLVCAVSLVVLFVALGPRHGAPPAPRKGADGEDYDPRAPKSMASRAGLGPIVAAVAKVLASGAFLAAAALGGCFQSIYGQAVFVALVWSALGDVLLIVRGARVAFLMGLIAFAVAHIGYIVAFKVRGIDGGALAMALGGLAVVGFVVWRWVARHLFGEKRGMRGPVLFYITVITAMVAASIGSAAAVPDPLPVVGAVLFWLSDVCVARERFVQSSIWNRLIGLPLYYAAQFVFIASAGVALG